MPNSPNRPRMTPPGPALRPVPRGLVPRAGTLAALLALVLLTGCAYFNTFYHARRFYNQAERARINEERTTGRTSSSNSSNLYKQAIDKCEKLIENYPGSKWQDDAYLLMAKSYYRKGDYLGADNTLDAFMEKFPKSELLPDALFLRGLTQYANEDYDQAHETWTGLLKTYPKYEDREEVEFYLADAQWKNKRLDLAEDAYRTFLTRNPNGSQSTTARLNLGQILLEEKKPEDAEKVFRQVAEKGKVEDERIQARLLWGQAMEDQSRYEDALSHYRDLEADIDPDVFKGRLTGKERQALEASQKAAQDQAVADSLRRIELGQDVQADNGAGDETDPNAALQTSSTVGVPTQASSRQNYYDRRRDLNNPRDVELAQVMLREGMMLTKLERPWDAILVFEQVVSEYPSTPYAAEAQYRIGYTQEVDLEDLNSAQRAYAKVSSQGPSAFREDAVRRAKNLETVRNLMATAKQDTVAQKAQAATEARFMRAELYLFQQENTQKAIDEYQGIEKDYAGTETAAKAGLALAWITQHTLNDSAAAMAKYTEVAEKYPDTEYGRRAHRVVYGPEPELTPLDYAGPSLAQLTSPENLAAVKKQEGEDEQLVEAGESTGTPENGAAAVPQVIERPGGVSVAQTPQVPPPANPPATPAGGSLQDALAATRSQQPGAGGQSEPAAPGDDGLHTAAAAPPGTGAGTAPAPSTGAPAGPPAPTTGATAGPPAPSTGATAGPAAPNGGRATTVVPPPAGSEPAGPSPAGAQTGPSAPPEPEPAADQGGPRPDQPVPGAPAGERQSVPMREVTPPVGAVPQPAMPAPSAGVNPSSAPEGSAPSTAPAAKKPASSAPPSEGPGSPAPRPTGPTEVPAGLYLDPLAVPADGPSPVTEAADTVAVEKGKTPPPSEEAAPPADEKKKESSPPPKKKDEKASPSGNEKAPPPKNEKAKSDSTSAKDKP